MRPIDADGLMGKLYAKASEWRGTFSGVAYTHACEMIEKEPTLDIVEVVRCKDCVHLNAEYRCVNWRGLYDYTKADDFCSYGERRADDATD